MKQEPKEQQQRCDWVEEVRLRCYNYTEFYGGERVIRFDELEGVIEQLKEERKGCYDTRSRPHPAPAPKFNSTELLLLAHDEWKRREERKHNHPEQDWVAGFLSGFCTSRKWAREYVDRLQAGEP